MKAARQATRKRRKSKIHLDPGHLATKPGSGGRDKKEKGKGTWQQKTGMLDDQRGEKGERKKKKKKKGGGKKKRRLNARTRPLVSTQSRNKKRKKGKEGGERKNGKDFHMGAITHLPIGSAHIEGGEGKGDIQEDYVTFSQAGRGGKKRGGGGWAGPMDLCHQILFIGE